MTAFENGDIASGSSDGIVRIFTRDEAKYAPAELITAYDDANAKHAIPTYFIQRLADFG